MKDLSDFKVILHRDYLIDIKAKNVEDAKFFAEYFIGDPKCEGFETEKKKFHFNIKSIEMVNNDAFQVQ